MPNYNQTLQSNNIDLQAILDTVNELPNAGGSNPILQDKTVTPTTSVQKVTADNNYDGLNEVTVNAMPTATQATPTISINSSTGLITATATQTAGYVAAGTKSATKQLAFQAAQTITPGTTNKTIAANTYLGGVQTIKGDANLVAGNIKSGVSIFGVTGTHSGGEDLEAIISEQEALIQELSTTLDSKASGGSGSGSVETCTVTVDLDVGGNFIAQYAFMVHENGQTYIKAGLGNNNYDYILTVSNVVCNSIFYINHCTVYDMISNYSIVTDGGVELIEHSNVNALIIAKASSINDSVGHLTVVRNSTGDDGPLEPAP